jgi:hypothetical protein
MPKFFFAFDNVNVHRREDTAQFQTCSQNDVILDTASCDERNSGSGLDGVCPKMFRQFGACMGELCMSPA